MRVCQPIHENMNPFNLSSPSGPLAWFFSGILLFLLLEKIIPFRATTLSQMRRWRINFSMNFCNVLLVDLFFVTLLKKTSMFSGQFQFNLFKMWHLNMFWGMVLTIVVLDLGMYLWHRLNHSVPFLWQFHKVHHTDLNVDVSSAARFHFGEVTGSTIINYTLMLFLGATIVQVRLFQVVLLLMAQFGHSNVKLGKKFEEYLWLIVVPPAMHKIHHSNVKDHTDSNYGTIFSIWDRVFGSFKKDVDQEKIIFGLKEFSDPKELMLFKLLVLPFRGMFKIRK